MAAPSTFRRVRDLRRSDGLVALRSRRLGASTRVHARSIWVTSLLVVATVGVFAWSISVGDLHIPITDVISALLGFGSDDADFVINRLRLPRALTAVLVGAAFGLAGAIFQRTLRNPLASPDLIAVNAGAGAAAVFTVVMLSGSSRDITLAALTGGAGTGVAIYLLAYRRGVSGYRLVLVGIGVTALMHSITSYLLTRAQIYDAQQAMVWITGSLNGRTWDHVRPLVVALAVLIPVAIALARHLRMLELGDETARGLGTRVEPSRAGLLLVGVALAAVATASAGPVAFVALAAPQVARRLVGERTLALLPSAACGALLLTAADIAARRTFATELPVGVFTAILGAPYLLSLLVRANRIGSGG